jgi:hypothetical protein
VYHTHTTLAHVQESERERKRKREKRMATCADAILSPSLPSPLSLSLSLVSSVTHYSSIYLSCQSVFNQTSLKIFSEKEKRRKNVFSSTLSLSVIFHLFFQ